ncbi:SurA N-terminal domain-containing protein [Streptomyces sp. STR69]|uniref:SurA N-terminal domain-containing protein n=1 Tax=Streptomyces sp. STR69 TaxID=1796942 RepID=UPI0021C896C5|nr:SurA N-terminal domain-containing protein [Streptomyces sp. STR69]
MNAFIQQLPALIGVVIGALGSYVAIVRGERVRFHREREARWEERRLAVYTDYARVLKRTVTLTYRVASHFRNDPHPHPLSPDEAAPLIAEAALARDPAGETLLMLGSPEVVAKARVWVTSVLAMERFLRDGTHDPEAWQDLLERQREGRQGYYAAVRDDLALPPGHSAAWVLPPVHPV